MKKVYELMPEPNSSYFRIRSLVDIPHWGVKAGDIGGLIAEEECLSHSGTSWIDKTSQVQKHVRIGKFVHVEHETILAGKVKIENAQFWGSSVDMDGVIDGGVKGCVRVDGSKLYESINIHGSIGIQWSELRNVQLQTAGRIFGSDLTNIHLLGKQVNIEETKATSKVLFVAKGKANWIRSTLWIAMGEFESESFIRDSIIDSESLEAKDKFFIEFLKTKGTLEKLSLLGETTNLKGDESSPIVLSGNTIEIDASDIRGSVQLDGKLSIVNSKIRDCVNISMDGTIEDSSFLEFASVNQPIGRKQAIMSVTLTGEDVYSPPF
ncbi:hypothetical protein JMA_38790 (plasmid) [Jeotgalibacillus malaysiensis]|uniref:Uncharacterized protein n=1 Tax=Jeotgalibacillus malaysiensis TaxID=1508404 RepID=A0A0B5AWX9_9BACL|nr:hypothetical protein [Jeotgalibacillus malaysiensis]AJD93197.1 hypothetical protein JMA_38790 [Jeotgalibacillus malaysiensis]